MTIALLVGFGYLLGSCPWGYWLVRVFRREDIRKVGSGNIGATNVWRSYGRSLGAPVVALDIAKGFVPAFLGVALDSHVGGIAAGAAALAGHWRPLFLGFERGGKLIATGAGVFLGLAPFVGLAIAAVWTTVFLVGRYASLASIVAALATPVLAVVFGEPWSVVGFASVAGAAAVYLHRANLHRLRAGTERRFRFRKAAHG